MSCQTLAQSLVLFLLGNASRIELKVGGNGLPGRCGKCRT